jgi:predicted CXXCH cytochrome family protein
MIRRVVTVGVAPAVVFAALLAAALEAAGGVGETAHNLSVSGPGEVRAGSEERICIFCHAPHRATTRAPLWNRRDSRASYLIYESTTLDAASGQPTGASRMCLSCHDGTVALGDVVSEPREIEFPPEHRFLDRETGSLETDLADDHPISFVYDHGLVAQDPELEDPLALPLPVRLDAEGQMQCTSCHDPHDDSLGGFLLVELTGGALCTSCHRLSGWQESSHARSLAVWDGTPPDPWPGSDDATVAGNACRSCHAPHTAAHPRWNLRRVPEEQVCLDCHNAHVARSDLEAEFEKPYRHPLELSDGVHEPTEDPLTAPRHVECVDCHDPHRARGETGDPSVPSTLGGARGIDLEGQPVESVRFQYEVCFPCHGDGTDADQEIPRSAGEINTRLELAPDAISFHPVAQSVRDGDDPTLLAPYTPASQISCTDCHASDAADSGGPRGPHGSRHRFLLRRSYEVEDPSPESPVAYALCYGCHSRSVLLDGASSGFRAHRRHVVDASASCSVCHDPHGIASSLGDPGGNTHLINFDLRVVEPSLSGELRFEDRGFRSGACSLYCHGVNHDPMAY